jgi:chromosome segregation ATPase
MATETKQIEKQIDDLQARREQVASEAATAHRELESARRRHLSGEASASDVSTAQATHAALAGVVDEADGELERLRARLAQAQATDAEQAKAARIAELRGEQARLQSSYDQVRASASETVGIAAAKMIELGQKFHAATKEINDLSPAGPSTAIPREKGLTDKPLQFGESLHIAARILWNEEDRQRRKKMSRALTERERQREARHALPSEAA